MLVAVHLNSDFSTYIRKVLILTHTITTSVQGIVLLCTKVPLSKSRMLKKVVETARMVCNDENENIANVANSRTLLTLFRILHPSSTYTSQRIQLASEQRYTPVAIAAMHRAKILSVLVIVSIPVK